MSISVRKIRRSVMGVSDAQATGFSPGDTATWKHLEAAPLAAIEGYHAVLDGSRLSDLIPRLDQVPLPMRGYAYEGAAMGLTCLDCFLPGRSRLAAYLAGPGAPHVYMVHIGAGEALARLRRRPEPFIARMPDRVLCWLVMDGYGFHEGFFSPQRYIDRHALPKHLSGYGRRVFDQGLGRSIWFRSGADPELIAATLAAFPAGRQGDLWLGIGVACAYVGGVGQDAVEALRWAAGAHAAQLAVGAAFVAKGRERACNPTSHTELAVAVLCRGMTAAAAARTVDEAFRDLPLDGPDPAYAALQRRLAARFAPVTAGGDVT